MSSSLQNRVHGRGKDITWAGDETCQDAGLLFRTGHGSDAASL